MKKLLITLLAACGMAFLACSAVSAMPGNPASIPDTMKTGPVEPVRLYCYSRSTGQFLHWGPCGGYGYGYYRPHYYYHPHYYHYYRPYYHRWHRW